MRKIDEIFRALFCFCFETLSCVGVLASSGISGAEAHEIKKTENRPTIDNLSIFIPRPAASQTLVTIPKNSKDLRCLLVRHFCVFLPETDLNG